MGQRDRRVGDMLGLSGDFDGAAQRKSALYMARADAARAARSDGHKPPLRRLLEHLLQRRPEETKP